MDDNSELPSQDNYIIHLVLGLLKECCMRGDLDIPTTITKDIMK